MRSTVIGGTPRGPWLQIGLFAVIALSTSPVAWGGDFAPDDFLQRAQILTAPELAGRGAGTPEGDAAADTVAVWLHNAGLQPAFAGHWLESFPLQGEALTGKTMRNVAGVLRGDGDLAHRWIVVSAHYDHLGRVEPAAPGAPPPASGEYYPGANDNASGVTILVALARAAVRADADASRPRSRRSVLFVAFGAEEVGLQGSAYLVAQPPMPRDQIDLVLNLDSVGRLSDGALYVSGVGTAPGLEAMISRANSDGCRLELAAGAWSGSDHTSFLAAEIAALFLFTGAYREYNCPTDDWPTLDVSGLITVAQFASRLLADLRTRSDPFTYQLVAPPSERIDPDEDQNRNTWFGSLPDFGAGIIGYRLAGVFDGSPAERSGMQKGDVIVSFGGAEVTDLASFTRALRSHAPGDLVEVEIMRGERRIRYTVVLADRQDR